MIRTDYYKDEDLKEYEVYGIQKTEVVVTSYGERKYVTFGAGLCVGYGDTYLGDGDSVWYVRIWNPVTKKEDHIGMGYTNQHRDNVDVSYDATAQVISEWTAWKVAQEEIRLQKEKEYAEADRKYRAEQEALTPSRGKTVKVVKGRKLAHGTEARVFWRGQTQYGWSVGLELSCGEKVFVAEKNVEVVR